jgi:hypothetical protein
VGKAIVDELTDAAPGMTFAELVVRLGHVRARRLAHAWRTASKEPSQRGIPAAP